MKAVKAVEKHLQPLDARLIVHPVLPHTFTVVFEPDWYTELAIAEDLSTPWPWFTWELMRLAEVKEYHRARMAHLQTELAIADDSYQAGAES